MAGRSPITLIRCAQADQPPALRPIAAPNRRDPEYRDTPRPLLAHADPGQLRALALERRIYSLLRPALWPIRLLSAVASRNLDRKAA